MQSPVSAGDDVDPILAPWTPSPVYLQRELSDSHKGEIGVRLTVRLTSLSDKRSLRFSAANSVIAISTGNCNVLGKIHVR